MKRILFLTHYFPPEINAPANRTYEHCKRWKDEYDITVLTNTPNHPDGVVFKGYKNRFVQNGTIDGINVKRVWTLVTPNEGFLLRTLNYIIYMIMAVITTIFSRRKYDAVIATSPQFFCGIAGKWIAKIKRLPFILEIRDLWPESIIAVGALENKFIINRLRNIEKRLYKSATKIVTVTSSFKEILIEDNIEASKIEVVYNGIDPGLFRSRKEISKKEIVEFATHHFTAGYIGTIGMAHAIETVVEAARILKQKDESIRIMIIGSGANRYKIKKMISDYELDNIALFGIQPREEIPSIIDLLDVHIVHLRKNELFKTAIPSKMFEGMIMKKPVLLGVEGESRDIIEKNEAGIGFEPENARDLIEKLLYLKDNSAVRNKLSENGYRVASEKFSRDRLAAKMKNLIDSILEKETSE